MVLSLYGLKLFVTNRCTRLDFPTPDASIKQQVAAIINGRYGWPVTEDETRDSRRSQSYARRRAVTPTTLVRLYNVTKGSQIPMVSPHIRLAEPKTLFQPRRAQYFLFFGMQSHFLLRAFLNENDNFEIPQKFTN